MIPYSKFASTISFFEFIQDEFHKPHLHVDLYSEELKVLKRSLSVELLAENLKKYPRIFDLAEEYFQLKRFTNTQYTHFLFDVSKLNLTDFKMVMRYVEICALRFEDGSVNELFGELVGEAYHSEDIDIKITGIKRSVVEYVARVLRGENRAQLHGHIQHSLGARTRIAGYLVENLHADEHFANIDISKYLTLKRIPRDTKGIHGKFGVLKIRGILSNNLIPNIDGTLKSKNLDLFSCADSKIKKLKYSYVTECQISGVEKRNSKKSKRFDFVVLKNGIPTYCIETNFYSTTGTKIGINIGEYTDLLEDIDKLNAKRKTNLRFIWITDGNHWLTAEGEKDYGNLKSNHFRNDLQLLNYNLFAQKITDLIK